MNVVGVVNGATFDGGIAASASGKLGCNGMITVPFVFDC
jgi:hypothetical protein